MRSAIALAVLLIACGGGERQAPEPSPEAPAPPSVEPEGSGELSGEGSQTAGAAESAPAPTADNPGTPTTPTTPVAPAPTDAEFDVARQSCSDAFTRLRGGELREPLEAIAEAVGVLRRAEGAAAQRVLGACLYNYGRALEDSLDIEFARMVYEESLEARANPVVAERRRRLGTREVDPASDRQEGIERQLARADGHPCGELRARCEARVLMYAHSGAGRLQRAAVLAVSSEESDNASLHLAWAGERGPFRWGPRLGPLADLDREGLQVDEPMGVLAFRPVRSGAPSLLFVRYETDWIEECCGGRSEGHNRDLAVCELGEEARCVFVAEERQCEGEAREGFDGYLPCEQDDEARVTVDERGLTLSGPQAESSRGFVRPGTHSWDTLFPAP